MTAPAAAVPVAAPARAAARVHLGDAVAGIIGAACALDVQVIGRLYLGELLLGGLALGTGLLWATLPAGRPRRWLAWLLAGFATYLLTLVATDLYRGTEARNYLRGWFRALLYAGDVLGLVVLGFQRRERLLWWTVGFAVSSLLVLVPAGALTLANWKFGAAVPVTLLALASIDGREGGGGYPTVVLLVLAHLLLDYRSLAAFCLLVGLGLALARRRQRHGGPLLGLRALVLAGVAAGAFGALYVSNAGLLSSGEALADRRVSSNIERAAGFIIGYDVISRSPLIGYGSWPRDDQVFSEWATLQEELGSALTAADLTESSLEKGEDGLIKTHSQILQAWVEAGLPGALFFAAQLAGLLWLGWRTLHVPQDWRLLPLCLFWVAWTGWAIIFSPFSGIVRLFNGISLAMALSIHYGIRATDPRAAADPYPRTHPVPSVPCVT